MSLTLPSLPRPRRRGQHAAKPPSGRSKPADLQPTVLHLGISAIHRNLLTGDSGTWAYFLLEPQRWAFLSGLPEPAPAGDRGDLLRRIALRTTDLAGHRIHLRTTTHALPYSVWAQRLHERSPQRLADQPGAETWEDFLVASQQRIAQMRAETPAAYLGVRLSDRRLTGEELASLRDGTAGPDDLTKMRTALRRITGSVRKAGFGAKPVSGRGLAWLVHSSIGLGVPADPRSLAGPTDSWGPQDMQAFTAPVYPAATPYSPTVRIRASRDGRQFERHVAVLTVDTFTGRQPLSPNLWPWAAATQQLPFHTEWSMTLDVNPGTAMIRSAEMTRQRAEAIREHYEEHDRTPPASVGRAITDAHRIEDEVQPDSGHPDEVAVRLVGPVRLAVIGDTEAETLEHVATTVAEFRDKQSIVLAHEYGQFAMYQEFWPGHSPQLSAFTHVFNAEFFATAVPHATVALGDQQGPYLGSSGRHAVMFDPTWGPEHGLSGLGFYLGNLGAGKTTLLGVIAEAHVRRGRQALIYDGSGGLARLCAMPHLTGDSRTFELTGAAPGTLIPYRLIPEPRRHDFPKGERDWRRAMLEADAERRDLMIDTVTALMPARLLDGDPASTGLIEDCVNACGGDYSTDPWKVVAEFAKHGPLGKSIAERLRAAAKMTGGALIFPEQGETDPAGTVDFDATLTVVTMRGLQIPPAGRPARTRAEKMAEPILHLASRHAAKAMYASTDPKLIAVSEGSLVTGGDSSFKAFMDRASVDSRKTNTHFAVDTQNPSHVLAIAPEITNLIGCAFAGRMGSLEAAAAALPFLLAPTGHGYERTLMDLEPGQFIARFYDGAVGPLQVDRDFRQVLVDALDTTPRGATVDEGPIDWAVEA